MALLDASTTTSPAASTITNLEAGAGPDASTGTYLEAEDGALSSGFVVKDDPTASGGRYLEVQTGSGVTSERCLAGAPASRPTSSRSPTTGTSLHLGSHPLAQHVSEPVVGEGRRWNLVPVANHRG